MVIKQVKTSGQLKTNTYIVHSESSLKGIVIDPGMGCDNVIEYIDTTGIQVEFVVNTHAHHDHCAGNADISNRYDAKIAYHQKDDLMMESLIINNLIPKISCPVVHVSERDILNVGGMIFVILETPGHTDGSISICCNQGIFIGDFDYSISFKMINGKIINILNDINQCQFGDSPKVYPGHGDMFDLSKIMHITQTRGRGYPT